MMINNLLAIEKYRIINLIAKDLHTLLANNALRNSVSPLLYNLLGKNFLIFWLKAIACA